MKTLTRAFLLFLVLAVASCDEGGTPKTPEIFPVRMEMADYHRELVFDQNDRLTGIKMISFFPNDVTLESTLNFHYASSGRIDSSWTTDGHGFKYTYEAGLLTRSDEYIDGALAQYHTFEYDTRNRISKTLSWQHIPEQGGWIPHQKSTYTFDSDDNLTESVLYYYNSGTGQHEMLTRFTYSDYDNKQSCDRIFDTASFNPTIQFRKNNPGKMVVQNTYGNTTSIEVYSYEYHSSGFTEKRITTTTFPHNGQTGSYETKFIFEVR
jgi:hypothetical protein